MGGMREYCLCCGKPRDDLDDACQESDSGVHEYASQFDDDDDPFNRINP